MRGSPLFRTLMILVVIATAGFLFARLTATVVVPEVVEVKKDPNAPIDVIHAKVYVTLSGGAKTVDLFANAGYYRFGESEKGVYQGDGFKIARENPVLDVKVDWLEGGAGRRFAKVVVEAEGEETFTHVFDAEGDIDDFVELPF